MAGPSPRVAIVGAGPAGAFAAARLLRAAGEVEVDLYERLPTPWGLLRGGVAPDHQEIKRLEDTFDRQTLRRGARFLGHVDVGIDLTHADLMRHYTAVIYATGAQTDKSLGIPGEDLPGSWAATEFVAWYNGHPDYRDLDFDLSAPRAVVIGNGNVAADVTRILMLSPAELRDLGRMDGVGLRVAAEEVELDPVSRAWLDEEGTFTAGMNVELLQGFAASPPNPDAPRRIVLRFLRSPVAIRGEDRVEAIDVGRNEITRSDDGTLRAQPVDEPAESIDCGLVLRSVGYRAVPLPDVPFDERHFVLPNAGGRVLDTAGEPLPGVYAVGWIKRGPTGILGTNKRDAEETVAALVEDLRAGALPAPREPGREAVDALLAERKPDHVTVEGWRAIDTHERDAAEHRPRVKLTSRDELLQHAKRV
jgi:ferredoxin--NADP+ reductase